MALGLTAALALGLLPEAVAGGGGHARLQLDVAPEVQAIAPAPGSLAVTPLLLVGATLFVRPLRDDATPLPLQPFLQRTGTVSLRLRGALPDGARGIAGEIEAAADVYATRWLALWGGLGSAGAAALDGRWDAAGWAALRLAAGVGLRVDDLRFDLGYRFASGGSLDPLPERVELRGGGAVVVGVRAVLVEHIDLRLEVTTSLAGDVVGRFQADYHASRRLGLLWGLVFGRGRLSSSAPVPLPPGADTAVPIDELFGGRFGLSWWWSPRLGLEVGYAPAWRFRAGGAGAVEQRGTVMVSTRF